MKTIQFSSKYSKSYKTVEAAEAAIKKHIETLREKIHPESIWHKDANDFFRVVVMPSKEDTTRFIPAVLLTQAQVNLHGFFINKGFPVLSA